MSAANTGGSPPREQRISAAFVELADTLVANFDLAAFLYRLTWHCVDLLQADGAGGCSPPPTVGCGCRHPLRNQSGWWSCASSTAPRGRA